MTYYTNILSIFRSKSKSFRLIQDVFLKSFEFDIGFHNNIIQCSPQRLKRHIQMQTIPRSTDKETDQPIFLILSDFPTSAS